MRKSVEEFARYVRDHFEEIDILVNNAGLIMGEERRVNSDGIEMTLAVNHFGHFYLTYLLWESLCKSPEARIINVSSKLHYDAGKNFLEDPKCESKPYNNFEQYNISKLFNVVFTLGLRDLIDRRKISHIKTASLHPGIVDSGFYGNIDDTFMIKCFKNFCCCFMVTN